MKIPVLFPKIFNYPFTYQSEISESLNSGDFVEGKVEIWSSVLILQMETMQFV